MAIPLLNHYADFLKSRHYVKFNDEQRRFAEIFFASNDSLFITGSAGVGKSFVTETISDFLFYRDFQIAKVAPTGVSALVVGGVTIHSFSGIGLGDEDKFALCEKVKKNKKARQRIRCVKILLIDEISMISADLLNKIDYIFKIIRDDTRPFGGVRILASGDFLQLSPVFKNTFEDATFAFNSKAWKDANIKTFELKKLVRQDSNSGFAKLLQEIRLGRAADFSVLEKCNNKTNNNSIRIFCKNVDVDKYNKESLLKIKEKPRLYFAQDSGDFKYVEFFDRNCPAPKILELKVGAQVMLLKNLDTEYGLVNGAMGVVENFTTAGVVVKFISGYQQIIELDEWSVKELIFDKGKNKYRIIATRKQIPLKLAYATTIHKSQGQTLDRAEIDLGGTFADHQVYTALSRLKTIEGLTLTNFSPDHIKVNKECLNFYENINN